MDIDRGDRIRVQQASGDWIEVVAASAPCPGRDFPIVWVVTLADWDAGDQSHPIAWPLAAVEQLQEA